MKKVNLVLSVLAFTLAIAGTFVTQANSESMLVSAFGLIPDANSSLPGAQPDCRVGTLVENNACDGPSTNAECHVTISGFGTTQFKAYDTDSGTACADPKYIRQ